MICSFCKNELSTQMLRTEGCGSCLGGCRKIHCPYCGQENPLVPELLEKFLKHDKHEDKKGNEE